MDILTKDRIKHFMHVTGLYPIHKYLKLKYHNYFAEHGYYPQKFYQFLSQYDKELSCQQRKMIAQKLSAQSSTSIKEVVNTLKTKGYLFCRFSDLGINATPTLAFLEDKIKKFEPLSHDIHNYGKLDSGKYENKSLSYHLHDKTHNQKEDPLLQLTMHPTLIEIASLYLGYLPLLDFISLVVTPVHREKQFGAQLWHRDLHHKNILKIFFSPFSLAMDQGPFQFFPPEQSTFRYYRYAPQSMNDQQLAESGLNPKHALSFTAGHDQVLFVDTSRCLHRGGCTASKPRFIATSAYCSPRHSFKYKVFKETDHYRLAFDQHREENTSLLSNYAK